MAHVFFNALRMILFGPAVERVFTRSGFAVIYAIGDAVTPEFRGLLSISTVAGPVALAMS